jgi:hypothetical protein
MTLTTACPAARHHNLLRTCFPTQTASVRALTVELPVRRRTRGRRAAAVAVAGSSHAFFLGLSIPTQAIFLIAKMATAAEGGRKVDRASRPRGNGLRLHARVTTIVFILMQTDRRHHLHQPVLLLHHSPYRVGAPRVLRTPMMTPPTHFPPAAAATTVTAPASAAAVAAAAAAGAAAAAA